MNKIIRCAALTCLFFMVLVMVAVADEWISDVIDGYHAETIPAMAVDDGLFVFVTYTDSSEFITTKYRRNGERIWARTYCGLYKNHNQFDLTSRHGTLLALDTSAAAHTLHRNTDARDTMRTTRSNELIGTPSDASRSAVSQVQFQPDTGLANGGAWFCGSFTVGYTFNIPSSAVRAPGADSQEELGREVVWTLCVDDEDNVWISGNSGTIKYAPNGDTLWTDKHGGGILAVDDGLNIYVPRRPCVQGSPRTLRRVTTAGKGTRGVPLPEARSGP